MEPQRTRRRKTALSGLNRRLVDVGICNEWCLAFNFVALTSDSGIKPAIVAEGVQLWSKHYSHVVFLPVPANYPGEI